MATTPGTKTFTLSLHDQTVGVQLPRSIASDIESLFPTGIMTSDLGQSFVTVIEHEEGYTIHSSDEPTKTALPRDDLPLHLMEEVTRALVTRLDTAIAFHAAVVGYNGTTILMPGITGSGKSSLAAWLLDNGFEYHSDEIAILTSHNAILGFPRALVIKPGAAEKVRSFSVFKHLRLFECGSHLVVLPAETNIDSRAHPVRLIVFPKYEAGGDAKIEAVTEGETGLKLIACNLNARNLQNGGFHQIAALSRRIPAIVFRYGSFDQLKGTLDAIIRLAVDNQFGVAEMRRFLACSAGTRKPARPLGGSLSGEPVAGGTEGRGSSALRGTGSLLSESATQHEVKDDNLRREVAGTMTLTGYVVGEYWPKIQPAPLERTWMDTTKQRFAYRCLPLNIANGHGWEILCPSGFSAIWNGGAGLDAVSVHPDAGTTAPALSHFGRGVLTFLVPCLFRTNPSVDLMVQGPVNRPKDAIAALTGCVETDWTPFTFTMNWLFTRPGVQVRFEEDEPYCHIFPVRRGELEAIAPVLRPLSDNSLLSEQYETWAVSRMRFNEDLKQPGSLAQADKYQQFYHQGLDADKFSQSPLGHRTRLRLRPFAKG